jgi:hypothetical protein
MANSTSIQILSDGPARTVIKFEGVLDTSDLSSTTVADPATLQSVEPMGSNTLLANRFRVDKIIHNIEDGLSVNFFWDASTPVRIEELTGRGKAEYRDFGGLKSAAGTYSSQGIFTPAAGHTGKITATTQGWAASAVLSFSVILYLTKVF